MTKWTEEEQQKALADCRGAITKEGYKSTLSAVVGSTYIAGEGQDIDCLFLVEGADVQMLSFDGWLYGGSVGEGNDSQWGSWKRGHVNMLVTSTKDYYNAWLTSAEVCRLLHRRGIVVPRQERVAIHNIIMDDSTEDQEVEFINKWPGNVNDKP